MIYEAWEDERGHLIKKGDVVYASLESGAINRGFYRYTPHDNGVTDFFDADGDSAERFLIRQPVPGGAHQLSVWHAQTSHHGQAPAA